MTKVRQKISLRLHKAGQDLIDGAGKSNRLFPREMRCTPPPQQTEGPQPTFVPLRSLHVSFLCL